MTYLLDTNVLSEAHRPAGAASVKAWLVGVPAESLFISVLVVGEIRRGVERLRRRDPTQAALFDRWLGQLEHDFAERIVPITAEIADEWGRLNARDPLPVVDSLLAATARVHGWTLVTRNVADIERTGVTLFNPFDPTP